MNNTIDYFFFAEKIYEACLPVIIDFANANIDERNAIKRLNNKANLILRNEYYFGWSSFLENYYSMYHCKKFYSQKIDCISFAPYWMYKVGGQSCYHLHKNYDNAVFKYDDPFWVHFFPPNSWECGCTIRNYTKEELAERNLVLYKGSKQYFVVNPPFDINFAKRNFDDIYKKLFIQHLAVQIYENENYEINECDEDENVD